VLHIVQNTSAALAITFMRNNRTASVAMVTPEGKPHNALVYCLIHDDLSIYFTTRAEGRKFQSLMHLPEVCMLFAGYESLQQIQLSGTVHRIEEAEAYQSILHELRKLRYQDPKLPPPADGAYEPSLSSTHALFQVRPFEMTYADFDTGKVGVYQSNFKVIL
jgi:general stress protein 26